MKIALLVDISDAKLCPSSAQLPLVPNLWSWVTGYLLFFFFIEIIAQPCDDYIKIYISLLNYCFLYYLEHLLKHVEKAKKLQPEEYFQVPELCVE